MSRLLRLLAIASLALSFAHTAQAKEDGFDRAAYVEAVEKIKSGDLTIDFKWLRQQNAIQFHYSVPDWDEARRADEALPDAPETALKLAQAQIEANFLDIYAHAVADTAFKKLGRTQEAQAEHALILALLSTVTDGRDGQSADQAWNAVSVDEEYIVLNLLGFRTGDQALANTDGHVFDVMTVTDRETGDELKIWFNIDFFFGKELS